MFGYEYGSSNSSAMEDSLSFRGVIYDVAGANFEVMHHSPYDY